MLPSLFLHSLSTLLKFLQAPLLLLWLSGTDRVSNLEMYRQKIETEDKNKSEGPPGLLWYKGLRAVLSVTSLPGYLIWRGLEAVYEGQAWKRYTSLLASSWTQFSHLPNLTARKAKSSSLSRLLVRGHGVGDLCHYLYYTKHLVPRNPGKVQKLEGYHFGSPRWWVEMKTGGFLKNFMR